MQEPFAQSSVNFMSIQTWADLYPNLIAGFSTRNGGKSKGNYQSLNLGFHVGDDPETVLENRYILADELELPIDWWVSGQQTHENRIQKVTRDHRGLGASNLQGSLSGIDGLYTKESNVVLTAGYADCVPLFFIAPKEGLVGIAHAGWRGTVQNIAGNMIDMWVKEENVNPSNIYVMIGPSIGSCCYQVDNHVINYVTPLLSSEVPKPYKSIDASQYLLDLKSLNFLLLTGAGVPTANISKTSYCTSCQSDLFFSHRRDQGKTGRMLSVIAKKED